MKIALSELASLQNLIGDANSEAIAALVSTLEQLATILPTVFDDPWFSSLWTLQEAFLCPNASLLARDGPVNRGLNTFTTDCDNIHTLCGLFLSQVGQNSITQDGGWVEPCRRVVKMIQSSGVPALATRYPLATYCVAGFRTASRDSDYVYGIQQIFEYRLGNTASVSETTKDFTREHLEIQLGTKLLEDWPVQSQFHVFTRPPQPGTGWHMNLTSRIPNSRGWRIAAGSWWWRSKKCCELSVVNIAQAHLGYFTGRVCNFSALQDIWRQAILTDDTQDELIADRDSVRSIHQIALDVADLQEVDSAQEPLEYRTSGFARDILPGEEQQELAAYLTRRYSNDRLIVLLLGRVVDDIESRTFDTDVYHIGLLLVQQPKDPHLDHWRRIGFCHWKSETLSSRMRQFEPILAAKTECPQWRDSQGTFS